MPQPGLYLLQYAICNSLWVDTWSVSWNVSETASLRLRAGSHLYPCCCLEWPQESSCGREIKLKFCHLEADYEINILASKKLPAVMLTGQQGDFATADFGASCCCDSEWAGGPCSLFSSTCPLLCVVALSAAALEQKGWRPFATKWKSFVRDVEGSE